MINSLKNRVILNAFRQYKHNQARIHELKYLFWECTLRCNLSCRHCGSDCHAEADTRDMPAEHFLEILDSIEGKVDPGTTMIVLTGGEPLLRQDLITIGREITYRGFPWGLVTNGFLMTEDKLNELSAAGIRALTVSLDGTEESHNWLRNNKLSFHKAIRAIQLPSGTKNLVFDVVTCIHQGNIDQLSDIRDLLITIGVKDWRLFTIFPAGRAADRIQFKLEGDQFRRLLEFIAATRKEGPIHASFGCEGYLGDYELKVRDHPFFCQAGISIASVLADGSISACPAMRDQFIQGNIYQDSFMEVWEERFRPHRDRDWARTGICKQCEDWKWCEGNGMHLHPEKSREPSVCHLRLLT